MRDTKEKAEFIVKYGFPDGVLDAQEVAQAYLNPWISVIDPPEKAGRYWVYSTMFGDYEGLFTPAGKWFFNDEVEDLSVAYYAHLPNPPRNNYEPNT